MTRNTSFYFHREDPSLVLTSEMTTKLKLLDLHIHGLINHTTRKTWILSIVRYGLEKHNLDECHIDEKITLQG